MKLLPLRNSDKYALVDDEDYDALRCFQWAYHREGTNEYAVMRVYPKMFYMHRLIQPGVELVDHKDGNGLNNQRSNIRAATKKTNSQNRQVVRGKSPHKGVRLEVSKSSVKYRSRIAVEGARINLGLYSDPISAAMAYDAAATKHFGEFAYTNFKGG